MNILKKLEEELKDYRPKEALALFYKNYPNSQKNNSYSHDFRKRILSSVIEDYGNRAIGLELVGGDSGIYEEFEVKNQDKMELEKSKNARYCGINYYEIFDDEILVSTLYTINLDDEIVALEVLYEASLENLMAFLTKSREKDLKELLNFIKRDKGKND